MKRSRFEIDMCNGSIMDKLVSFALPLMVSSILQLMFNAVDIIVVGAFLTEGKHWRRWDPRQRLINIFYRPVYRDFTGSQCAGSQIPGDRADKGNVRGGTYGDHPGAGQRDPDGGRGRSVIERSAGTDGDDRRT